MFLAFFNLLYNTNFTNGSMPLQDDPDHLLSIIYIENLYFHSALSDIRKIKLV